MIVKNKIDMRKVIYIIVIMILSILIGLCLYNMYNLMYSVIFMVIIILLLFIYINNSYIIKDGKIIVKYFIFKKEYNISDIDNIEKKKNKIHIKIGMSDYYIDYNDKFYKLLGGK